jgi:hypothetical protein
MKIEKFRIYGRIEDEQLSLVQIAYTYNGTYSFKLLKDFEGTIFNSFEDAQRIMQECALENKHIEYSISYLL